MAFLRTNLERIGAEAVLIGGPEFIRIGERFIKTIEQMNSSSKALESSAKGNAGFAALATSAGAASAAIVAASTAAGIAIASIGAAAVGVAADYQQAFSVVAAITRGTELQLQGLTGTIRDIGTTTTVSMSEAATAAAELARGGLGLESISSGALKAAINLSLASAGELELDRAATLVASTLSAFNLTGDKANSVVNAITAAAQKSSVTFVDMQRSFQQAAAVSSAFGLSAQETAAALGTLGVAGIRGSDAGTSLKQMFIQLAKPSKVAAELMNEYGISIFDAAGATRPFRDLVIDLQNKFGDLAVAEGKITEAERNRALASIFGSDALRAGLILAQQGVGVFDDMTRAMNDSTFSAETMAKIMQAPLNSQLIILGNNIRAIAQDVGSGLLPTLQKAAGSLIGFLQGFDPKALELFGLGLAGIFDTKALGEFVVKLSEVADPATAIRIQELIAIALNFKTAITEQILPALGELKDVILSSFTPPTLTEFITTARSISTTIREVAETATGVIAVFIEVAKAVKESGRAADILKAALIGIAVVPIAAVAILLAPLAATLALAALQAAALGIAIGLLVTNFDKVQAVGSLVVTTITNIAGALRDNAVPAALLLGAILTGITIVALGHAAVAFSEWAFIAAAKIAFVVFQLRTLNVATIATFVTTIPRSIALSVVAFGHLAVAAVQLAVAAVAATVRVGVSLAAMAVAAVVASAASVASFLNIARAAVFMGTAITIVAVRSIAAGLIPILAVGLVHAAAAGTVALISLAVAGIGSALAAIGAFVVAAAPVVLVIGAIVGAVILARHAWENNWLGIQGITAQILSWLAEKISGFINFLSTLPLIGGFIEGVGGAFYTLGINATEAGEQVGKFAGQLGRLKDTFTDVSGAAPTALDMTDFNADIAKALAELERLRLETPNVADELDRLKQGTEGAAPPLEGLGDAAGKAAKGLEEAAPAIIGFLDAVTKAARLQSFIDAFGEAGAEAIDSLITAVVSNIDKDGAKAGEAMHKLVQEMRLANVPEWEQLASDLNHSFATALIDRSPEAIDAAKHVVEQVARAMEAQGHLTVETFRNALNFASIQQQLGSEGSKIMESLNKSIVEGGQKNIRSLGEAIAGLRSSLIDDVPLDAATNFGNQLISALTTAIKTRTPEAVQAVSDLIRSIKFDAELIKLSTKLQTAVSEAIKTTQEAIEKIVKDANTEVAKFMADIAEQSSIKFIREALQAEADAEVKAITQVTNAVRDARRRNRDDLERDEQRAREDTDNARDRVEELAEIKKKAAEQSRTKRGEVLPSQSISKSIEGADTELVKLKERWAREDVRLREKRAREDADLVLKNQRDTADEIFNEGLVVKLADARETASQRLIDFNKGVEAIEQDRRVADIRTRAAEEIVQAQTRHDKTIADAQTEFDDAVAKLEAQRTLANEMFDGLLEDQDDAQVKLDFFSKSLKDMPKLMITIGPGATEAIGAAMPTAQHGGFVPGKLGKPINIQAHGGEFVASMADVLRARSGVNVNQGTVTNSTTYQVNANYERAQDPLSISDDMRALVLLAGK